MDDASKKGFVGKLKGHSFNLVRQYCGIYGIKGCIYNFLGEWKNSRKQHAADSFKSKLADYM